MLYYDLMEQRPLSEAQARERGLPVDDGDALADLNIFSLTVEQPAFDASTQGIEPDGLPAPSPGDPCAFVQKMRVFDLLERAKEAARAAVSAKRWEYETRGIATPEGAHIATGIDDQNRIASAIQGMRDAGLTEVDFKAASGWVRLTLEQMVGIAGMIAVHVQNCFTHERLLHERIDACKTLEELNAINADDEGWPGYVPRPEPEPEEGEGEEGEGEEDGGEMGTPAPEPGTDAGTDGEEPTGPEAGTEPGTEPAPETGTEPEPEQPAPSGPDAGPDAEPAAPETAGGEG